MNINRETLRLYWQQIRHHKVSFTMMLVAIPTGAMLIDSVLPYFLSEAIGAVTDKRFDDMTTLLWIAGGVGLVAVSLNLLGFLSIVHHEANVVERSRNHVFETLMRKDHQFFANQKIGAMTSKYIDFIRSHVSIQDLFVIRTLSFVLTMVSGLTLLAFKSPIVALIIFGLIVVLILQIRWSQKVRAPWRHERKTLRGDIHGMVADGLTNNLIVRTFTGEKRENAVLHKLTARFAKIYRKDIGFVVVEGSIRVLLMVVIQIITIVISAFMIKDGTLTVATAIFVLAYMQRIGSQLFVLSDIINGFDQSFLEAQPMTEILLTENVVADVPRAKTLRVKNPSIELDDISYRYPDGKSDVISHISATIPAGQKVGIVGHSGAGKSTIVQLLLRFSDVTDGAIRIDAHDIRDITQTSLREHIAYVPQEPLLFHRSLRENIAYGKPDASDDEIIRAAKQANAWEFIRDLPNGLDTTVGERGVKLSGGQRQRIAIARAIIKDAPILVLDEATSALDSESEKLIQKSLDSLMKRRTSLVIAHRLSTIVKLDRIIVLDKGTIIEDGTHTELLAKNGIYATLWKHQSGGFIEE